MAYQPKSYRKFLATSVAAAVVATAVAPSAIGAADHSFSDVESGVWYETNLDFTIEEGIIEGFSDDTFRPREGVTRAQAATMVKRALDLEVPADTSLDYTDTVDGGWYEEAIAAVSAADIMKGDTAGTFRPDDVMTRGEFAATMVRAYGLELNENAVVDFKDLDGEWSADDVKILASLGIVQGMSEGFFSPDGDVQRDQSTAFIHRTIDADQRLDVELNVPMVSSVSAINSKSVTVSGSSLDKATGGNFSIEGNAVKSYEVNEENTEATLTFEDNFASGEEQTVLLTQLVDEEEVTTEFMFTYTLEIGKAEVSDVVVDDNTSGQTLTFTLDGEEADVDYLVESGYTVEFQSTNSIFAELDADGNPTAATTLTSATGELSNPLTETDTGYGYKVVITDADDEVVAETSLATVVVEDLNSQFVSIDSYTLEAGSLTLENSQTALVGEDVVVSEVLGTTEAGDAKVAVTPYSVTSSNPAVAYVGTGNAIKTLKAGTTTVTLTAGETTTSFDLTVSADDARVASEATASPITTQLVAMDATMETAVDLEVTDQFGEVFTGNVFVELPTVNVDDVDENIVDFVSGTSAVAINANAGTFTVTGSYAGTGDILVKDKEDGVTLASVAVEVTEDTDVATRSFELVGGESDDLTLDLYAAGAGDDIVSDETVNFAYNQYNEAGFYIGKEALTEGAQSAGNYTVQVDQDGDADVSVVDNEVVVTAGTVAETVEVTISYGATVVAKKTVTVNDSSPEVSSLSFKSVDTITEADVTVNADTVLSIDEDTQLVSGLEVSTNEEVYFSSNTLYVDKDGVDGYDASVDLEVATLSWVGDSNLDSVTEDTAYTTVAGDNGNVIFTLSDAEGNTVDTTAVTVNVPAE